MSKLAGRGRKRRLAEVEEASPQEEVNEFSRVYVSGLPLKCDEASLREHFASLGGEVTDLSLPRKKGSSWRGIAFVGFKEASQAREAVEKLDRSFLRSSRLSVRPAASRAKREEQRQATVAPTKKSLVVRKTKRDEFFELMTGTPSEKPEPEKASSEAAFDPQLDDASYLKTKTRVAEPATVGERILVSNLPEGATEEEVLSYFEEKFGKVSEVHIPKNKRIAFVRYVLPESCEKTIGAAEHVFQGRVLRVVAAEEEEVYYGGDQEKEVARKRPRTFSERREAERRAKAINERSRLSGYVREDAVADAAAQRLGLSKSEIFDQRETGAAVAAALAESHVQTETASYFAQRGYDLTSTKKSRNALLVKNVASTTQAEMRALFVDCADVLVPPSQSTAVVEFDHPADARSALKRNAYRRFKHLPLYIDWAPLKATSSQKPRDEETPRQLSADGDDEEGSSRTSPTTVFVKNINFKTTSRGLREKFKHLRPRSVTLPNAGEKAKTNNGFGFIEFDSPHDARRAVDAISGTSLDSHRLEASLSQKRNSADSSSKNKKNASAKLVVRNLAFAATQRDVRDLFAAFGQVETVRIPKRFDGRHRGFAFVRFAARRDATSAVDALKDAHLYGRHLVIEFANEQSDETDAQK